MKVLVTGGCGLIGYHTSMYYHNSGDEVVILDNLERSSLLGHESSKKRTNFNKDQLEKIGIKVYPFDVSDPNSWKWLDKDFNTIIHLAGQCGVPTSIANPRRDYEVNLQGTFNALEYCRENGATLAFASTNKIYPIHDFFVKKGDKWEFINNDWNKYGFPIVNDLVGSRTPYGWSKYSADLLCQEYAYTYGVKTGVFRMSCIYGTNQFGLEEQGWAAWFTIASELGSPVKIYGDGCQVRDMLYVEDCVKAYDAFVQSNLDHGVWNLGGGPENTLSLNECLNILGNKSSVSYHDWRPSDQMVYVSDIRNLEKDLGWIPEVSPEEGLNKVRDWVREHKDVF